MASEAPGHHERLAHDDRRGDILAAVRSAIEEDGISRLSISSITKRVGCTRSLFYHYFPTKEDALQAVLDQSIDAFVERLIDWNASRVPGDIEGALDQAAHLLKSMVRGDSDHTARSVAHGGDASLYASFVHRVADRTARYVCSSTVVDFAARHEVRIDTCTKRSTCSSPVSSCMYARTPMHLRKPSRTSSRARCTSRATRRSTPNAAPSARGLLLECRSSRYGPR